MLRLWMLSLAVLAGWGGLVGSVAVQAQEQSPAEQQLTAAADSQQYAYLLFHRRDDEATRAMQATITAQVEKSAGKTVMVPVTIGNASEARLVKRFDATRMPMPCVMGIAPNGAVTGVYPLKVDSTQLERAVLTPKYSEMVKALQEQKIVLVCMHPAAGGTTPTGIAQFEQTPAFKGRTHSIEVQANEAAEQRFYERMRVSPDLTATSLVVFAPPGVFVGKFDELATGAQIAQQVHASGRCNCQECQQRR
ncbi:MAG: hypothetical protein ACK5Q5_16365 [Planctomycetaceae bacterium]